MCRGEPLACVCVCVYVNTASHTHTSQTNTHLTLNAEVCVCVFLLLMFGLTLPRADSNAIGISCARALFIEGSLALDCVGAVS